LQFTPRSLQSVAIGSRRDGALPTVHFIAARNETPRTDAPNPRKDRTMKTISTSTRLTSLLLAVLTSATVLGATVAGMQAHSPADATVVVMERVTVLPTAVR
jgi:hypothetical protein